MEQACSRETIEVSHPLLCLRRPELKLHSVRVFVAIITSGTPAAINQLVLTQLYNPAGTAHTLALFLSLQCELFVHRTKARS